MAPYPTRHLRDSVEAHLTIVFAALAVSRRIETQTGWSIRKFVKIARRCRTIEIQVCQHTITAADPLPADPRTASTKSTADQLRTGLSSVRFHTAALSRFQAEKLPV